jgi:hypothetical protein
MLLRWIYAIISITAARKRGNMLKCTLSRKKANIGTQIINIKMKERRH